ncbi:MAG: CBS domain-containing protein [Pyrinomonadaceae bacterium]
MSRDRYYRGDDDNAANYGRGAREREENRHGDERYNPDYGRRTETYRDRDYEETYARERNRAQGGERGYYGRDMDDRGGDYGRGRYGERADYRYDERHYGGRGGDGGRNSNSYEERDYDRYGEGRSLWEEGRDYVQRRRTEGRRATRSRVRCRDIMTRDVTVATRASTLQEVAQMMKEEDTGVIPVVERPDAASTNAETEEGRKINARLQGNGKLVGLITDRDIVVRALAAGKDPATTRVEEFMTTDVHTAKPNDRVLDAIRKMGDKQVRRIPVVDDNNNLLGIISMADVALETEEDRELADALEEISSGTSFWSKIFG